MLLAFFLVIPVISFAFTLTDLAFPLVSLSDLSHYEQDAKGGLLGMRSVYI